MPGGRTVRATLLALVPAAAFAAMLDLKSPTTAAPQAAAQPAPDLLKLEKGDHICIIGNTLADRMQHDGRLEAMIYERHPKHDLVIRNLGFSGDEVALRIRSADFGTPDQWLSGKAPIPRPQDVADRSVVQQNRFENTNTKADVIFAFFGYNESFAGEEGLPKFKADLDAFIKHTLAQKYNGKSAPRLVLFSPTAFEDHQSPNLPTGDAAAAINKNLGLYTKAMGEVAKANGVRFVDLFTNTSAGFANPKPRFTINGVHLNEEGHKYIANLIDQALFGDAIATNDLDRVRAAVLDKNFHWYQRYRVTDGYSTYGGRAWLKFVGGQTNYEVVQRELDVLDLMTSNRDKVIWDLVDGRGGLETPKPDDSNLPKFIPVTTNKPGKGPNGTHLFLSGEDAIKSMTIGKGLKVSLFADESMFPELAKPVQMAWDTKGRLWVAVWPNYPHWKPTEPYNDKILIFEDANGDGKADKMTVFADGLQNPTGFEFYNGGVIVAQAPDIMFLKDTNGDGRADVRERILHGFDTADTHHTSNSFVLDPGGAIYWQEGTFHRSQVEDPYGRAKRLGDGGVFRYEPRTQKLDVYVSFGFANPHGHVFDRWGQDIVIDGTGAQPYHAALFSGYLPGPNMSGREYPNGKHAAPPQVYQQRTRPSGGMEILSSQHFPPEFDGNLIVTNCIGFQGILRYQLSDVGGSLSGQELEPILSSSDPNFRPVDCKTGPDGALYFIDWQNPIIGHMQHNLRDPSRDRTKGRIYKVTYGGRAPSVSPAIAGEPIEKLLELLKHPEDRVRSRAKIELGARKTEEVIPAVKKWAQQPWAGNESIHHLLEALWVHQYHNVVDIELLKKLLTSPDFRARAAAVRVLCYWRGRVPNALDLIKVSAADEHPRVRLEAVRAASFFNQPEAVEVVFVAQEKPADQYVNFVIGETMKALNPIVQRAIAEKRPIKFTTPAGARFFLKSVATDDLLKMDRTPAVYLELLFRPGVRDEFRREAITALAKQDKHAESAVLINAIKAHDEASTTEESVAFDLARLLTAMPAPDLATSRAEIETLAAKARSATTRQIAYAAMLSADGAVDRAWQTAAKSVGALQDFVAAAPMVRDPALRAALYPKVKELLGGLPTGLAKSVAAPKSAVGRFVRIELPGPQRTLTLAEVEVFSNGENIARKGRATQTNTAYNGVAARAIDGNTSGSYGDNSQTHTREGIENPWWQVDLGRDVPIEKIVVWNRTDGNLADRLKNYTIRVLDANRKDVFVSEKNPTPAGGKADFAVGVASPEQVVRKAAMLALASVRGQESDAFKAIGKFLSSPDDRAAAVQALLRINPRDWPKEDAKAHLDTVMTFIRGLPVADRTTPLALDMMQLGEGLAGLLAPAEAKTARKELAEIGVRVIRVGTLFDQMSFDKERLVVQAGKPVEFVFENTDIMPHNFVIVSPGSLERVGNAAEEFATQPGAASAQYVPNMPSGTILLKSKLLQTRQVEQLKFTAPTEPGIYPYVCTYPGHWRRMHGALYVVADLDSYLENPEAYVARNPLTVKDELLKFNRPRTEWKMDELAGAIKDMETHGGRSFATGKQMFTVATCVACHKFGGQGSEFGPDLAKLDPKVMANSLAMTEHILEPAKRIDDKYAMYRLVLDTEKVITAMIVEEKDGVVKVIENPLASTKPLELKASTIVERQKLATSIMPKGLLDKLTKEEILDLLAYVWSKAEPQNKLFQGGHDHGGHGKH